MLQLTCRGNFNKLLPVKHGEALMKVLSKDGCTVPQNLLLQEMIEDQFIKDHQYEMRKIILFYCPLFELFPELCNHPFFIFLIKPEEKSPYQRTHSFTQRQIPRFFANQPFSLTKYVKKTFGTTPKSLRKMFLEIQSRHPLFPLSTNYNPQEKLTQVSQLIFHFQCLNYCLYFLHRVHSDKKSSPFVNQWLKLLPSAISQPGFIIRELLGAHNNKATSFKEFSTHNQFDSMIDTFLDAFSSFSQKASFFQHALKEYRSSYRDLYDTNQAFLNLKVYTEKYSRFLKILTALPFNQKNTVKKFHDEVAKLYSLIYNENFSLNQEINFPMLSLLKEISFPKNKKLQVVIPQSSHELKSWGHLLRNCVGTYDNSIANQKTCVLGIFEKGEIKYCLELSPFPENRNFYQVQINYRQGTMTSIKEKWQLVQFVGMNNQKAPPEIIDAFSNSPEFIKFKESDPLKIKKGA